MCDPAQESWWHNFPVNIVATCWPATYLVAWFMWVCFTNMPQNSHVHIFLCTCCRPDGFHHRLPNFHFGRGLLSPVLSCISPFLKSGIFPRKTAVTIFCAKEVWIALWGSQNWLLLTVYSNDLNHQVGDMLNKSPIFWKASMETLQEYLVFYCHVIKTH